MFQSARKTAMALALLAAFAAGGAALAGAATKPSTSSSTASSSSFADTARSERKAETALTGETAAKVKAAALAKLPGSTVLRVETDSDHGSPYEAHVRKSDGTEVEVLVNSSFEVTAVNEQRGRARGGSGGPGGPGGRGGDALTGTTATKVKAAAQAKVPGGTVLRVESGGRTNSAYHAHVRKSDGTEVVVLVNKDFEATSVQEHKNGRRS